MKWATGRPPGSGWQGCSLRRELEVAPKREQAGETSRRIRNSFELGKECRGCAPGRVTSKTNFHAPVIANCDCVLVPAVRRAFCTTCELRERRNYQLHKAAGYTLESMGSLLQNPVDDSHIVVAESRNLGYDSRSRSNGSGKISSFHPVAEPRICAFQSSPSHA